MSEDPPESVVQELVEYVRSWGGDGVVITVLSVFNYPDSPQVGVGGGSSMDAAKLAAFMCGDTRQVGGSRHPMVPAQSLEEMYGVDMCRGNRLPLVQVGTRPKSNIEDGLSQNGML